MTANSAAPASPGGASPSLQFIGNATMLIRFGALTVLTDPNFLHRGQRAYLGHGIVSKRLTDPAIAPQDLPALDAVLLSHLHGDHWDRVTQAALKRTVPILTTPHASRRLQWRGFPRAIGLQTWSSHQLVDGDYAVRITSLPGQHAPTRLRRLLPPVMGSLLQFTQAGAITHQMYISGDTLMVDELARIPHQFADIDTTVLHLGGTTLPGGLMVTMDARQGADPLEIIPGSRGIPVHHSDYTVFKSPLFDFKREIAVRGLAHRVTYLEPGQTIALPTRAKRDTNPR